MSDLNQILRSLAGRPAVAAVLAAAQGPVWLVGGSVRDLILGRDLADADLVTYENPEEIARLAAERLGVRPVKLGRGDKSVYRLPDRELMADVCPLTGGDIRQDLARRDLTVNALAVELTGGRIAGEVIDVCGGLADLEARRARFVSEENVTADPVRLLRLFRFAAACGLVPDKDSLCLVEKHKGLIANSAGERVREELWGLFSQPGSAPQVRAMAEAGLLEAVFPELTPLKGCIQGDYHHLDVWGHTLEALSCLEEIISDERRLPPGRSREAAAWLGRPKNPARLKLAVLLHDLGKPATRSVEPDGRIRFIGHDKEGEVLAATVAGRLKMSAAGQRLVCFIVRHHLRPFLLRESWAAGRLTPRGVYRLGRLAGDDLWGPDLPRPGRPGGFARAGPKRGRRTRRGLDFFRLAAG